MTPQFDDHAVRWLPTTRRPLRDGAAGGEFARGQEGYDARLYDLWERWNEEFFDGELVPPLIQLAEPGQTRRYGDCSTHSGMAGLRSRIRIRPSILARTPLIVCRPRRRLRRHRARSL
jgi:hypothetical protein